MNMELQYLLILLAVLIPVAVLVYWLGQRRLGRQMSSRNLEAKGRRWGSDGPGMEKNLRKLVDQFSHKPILTPIAELRAGPCMIRGHLLATDLHLGGIPGQECIWRNRLYGRREMAVAAEKVMIEDVSGKAFLEHLEQAFVVAPHEKFSPHYTSISLYVGDLVEVIGWVTKSSTHGTLGANGQLYIRVCERTRQILTSPSESQQTTFK